MAKGKFVIYKDVAGEFRWNLKAPNGEIIADSNEGYKAHKECATRVSLVIKCSKTATIEDTTGEAPAKKATKKKAAKKKAKK